jgi:hypothetical protein
MIGIVIQHVRCPRCRIRRTGRLGSARVSFCFNCRRRFGAAGPQVADLLAPAK